MATQVDIPFQGWLLSGQDPLKEGCNGLVQEMLDHGSISFGRYATEPLLSEKYSVFSHDTCQEELGKLTYPSLVAQKKAYFEEYYKNIRALKALEEDKPTETENTCEILTEHIEIDPKNDKMMECEVDASKFSVPEVMVQNESHENESTGKENPLQLVLRNTTNIIEHGLKSTLDSDSLSTSCVTDVAMEKDVNQTESGTVNPLPLVRRKTVDEVEHEKKLVQEFDSLSKEWVKFKRSMASIGGKERRESINDDKNGKVTSAVTKSFGADKDTTVSRGNVLRQKVHMPQIKSFKEPKQPAQKVNSVDTKSTRLSKLSTGCRVTFNSRPNSLSSDNRPLRRAKFSLPSLNEASRVPSKTLEKSASNPSLTKGKSTRRSSLDSLMKPTASSNARSIKSEVKSFRNRGVAKKPLPSCVPKVLKRDASHSVLPKRRSSNVPAQDKLPRTRSGMASKTPLHGKKPKQAKVALTSRKRVEPKKAFDLNTRSKKLIAARKEALPTYKRTKALPTYKKTKSNECPLRKNQRHENPPWR